MAKSYRLAFELKKAQSFFIKNNFEISKGCNSRFSSSNTNFVGRLVNTVVSTVNKHKFLPKYAIFILDGDIIEFVKGDNLSLADRTSISELFGTVVEHIMKEVGSIFKECRNLLPVKCKDETPTQIYWMACPTHVLRSDNEIQRKFNLVLESVVKLEENMRVAKMKDVWDPQDTTLVVNHNFTCDGLDTYWKAVDASIEFNIQKHREYLIFSRYNAFMGLCKEKSTVKKNTHDNNRARDSVREDKFRRLEDSRKVEQRRGNLQDIPDFFHRHREAGCTDRFRWSNNTRNRFALPRLSNC